MSHKIKTDIGYCVVSDDCALDEGELKTLAADIKKQPKLTQPNFFIDMRYDYKFIQLQALLKITELLQPMIQGNIKNKTAGIVNMDSVYVYQERNEVEIVLPLASFGVLRHYYEELRAALIAMPAIQVEYPKWSHKVRKTLYGKGPLCTYVAISRDEKNKRRELVHFFFPIEVAACMVTPHFGKYSVSEINSDATMTSGIAFSKRPKTNSEETQITGSAWQNASRRVSKILTS